MKQILSYLKQKKGSGIVTVMLAVLFLTAFGTLALYLTYTSFEMVSAERKGKEATCNADTCMDEIKAGVQGVVSDSLIKTYSDIMPSYADLAGDISDVFAEQYYNYIVGWEDETGTKLFSNMDKTNGSGIYNPDVLQSMVKEVRGQECEVTSTDGSYNVEINTDSIIIKNIKVDFKNGSLTSTVTSDLKIGLPDIGYLLTAYSISDIPSFNFICKGELSHDGTGTETIRGSAYCGSMKLTNNGRMILAGNADVICKGDLNVSGGGTNARIQTSGGTSLWAGDIKVGDYGKVALIGTTYVADDYEINGINTTNTISGTYFGFGTSTSDYDKSSSIIVNNVNASVNFAFGNDGSLTLAGVSFVKNVNRFLRDDNDEEQTSKETIGKLMGESFSATKNQYAYFAPDGYVEIYEYYKKLCDVDGKYYILNNYDNNQNADGFHFVDIDENNNVTIFKYTPNIEAGTNTKEIITTVINGTTTHLIGTEDYNPSYHQVSDTEVTSKTQVFNVTSDGDEFDKVAFIKLKGETYTFNGTRFVLTAKSKLTVPGLTKSFADYNCSLKPIYQHFGSKKTIAYFLLSFDNGEDSDGEVIEANQYANAYFSDYFNAHTEEVQGWINEYTTLTNYTEGKFAIATAGNFPSSVNKSKVTNYVSLSQSDLLTLRDMSDFIKGQFDNLCVTLKNQTIDTDAESPYEFYVNTAKIAETIPAGSTKDFYVDDRKVAIIVNGSFTYNPGVDSNVCMIIATGDITMNSNYKGLAIAGGNIILSSSCTFNPYPDNVVAAYQADDVSGEDVGANKISNYLNVDYTQNYETVKSHEAVAWSVPDLVTYENWDR